MTNIEIVGFRFPGGFLRYQGGMLVVYGQNGAGKSLLLESIASSMTGRLTGRTEADWPGAEEPVTSAALVKADRRNPSPGRSQLADFAPSFDDPSLENLERSLLLAHDEVLNQWASEFLGGAHEEGAHAAAAALFVELEKSSHIALAPTGSARPRWTGYVATDPDSTAPSSWASARESIVVAPLRMGDFERVMSNLDGFFDGDGIYRFNLATLPLEGEPFGTVFTEDTADPDQLVARWLQPPPRGGPVLDDPTLVAEHVQKREEQARAWTERANELLRKFLLDPPMIRLEVGQPLDWMISRGPHWESTPGGSIGNLSDAEKRWSRIAIALAAPDLPLYRGRYDSAYFPLNADADPPVRYLLLDEPERGLHRMAEAHLAAGLLDLVRTSRVKPIIATHSPALLDAGLGQIVQITKSASGGIGDLVELTPSEIDELKSFGLQPSSLLQRDRGYLLVEGEHDKQILEGWFAEELRSLRVAVLPMRGTKNLLTVFDAALLIERTDSLLMPLLDDIEIEPLFDLWAHAEAQVADGRPSDAVGIIRRGMAKIPGVAKDDYEPFLVGAITRGVSARFFPLGMAKKDVLEYLPVSELVDGATSWADLRREWNKSPSAMADRSGKAYKDWLRKVKRADLSPENLRVIAETTAPHPDLKAIIAKISDRLGQP